MSLNGRSSIINLAKVPRQGLVIEVNVRGVTNNISRSFSFKKGTYTVFEGNLVSTVVLLGVENKTFSIPKLSTITFAVSGSPVTFRGKYDVITTDIIDDDGNPLPDIVETKIIDMTIERLLVIDQPLYDVIIETTQESSIDLQYIAIFK